MISLFFNQFLFFEYIFNSKKQPVAQVPDPITSPGNISTPSDIREIIWAKVHVIFLKLSLEINFPFKNAFIVKSYLSPSLLEIL